MRTRVLNGPRFELCRGQEGYPESLEELISPPEKIYGIGNMHVLEYGLAIVGSRKATPYGLSCARRFARIASELGICIVSGGALGCDSEAHRSAVLAKGKTVVVLGGGCDRVYPASNLALFQQVIDIGGAVISENAWDFKPLPYTFRNRNRIIAGLSRAVLIVEAGLPSGTFSTADAALEAGREVLAIPGAITSNSSRGANRLIYQGATPIVDEEGFEDVLLALFGAFGLKNKVSQHDEAQDNPVLAAVCAQPLTNEEIYNIACQALGDDFARNRLNSLLIDAQLQGIIKRQLDGRWSACVRD